MGQRHDEVTRTLHEIATQLSVFGTEGRKGKLDVAEIDREHARSEHDRVGRRARAVQMLREVMTRHRDTTRLRYVEPFRAELQRLGRPVFGPSFEVDVDSDLCILNRTLDGRTVPYESLSGGAKEQLGILARLAGAALVAKEDAVPILIDDALGFTDPERLVKMAAVFDTSVVRTGHRIDLHASTIRRRGRGPPHRADRLTCFLASWPTRADVNCPISSVLCVWWAQVGDAHPRIHPQISVWVCPPCGAAHRLESVFIDEVFAPSGGLATREQLLSVMSPQTLAAHVKKGAVVRIWHGVYAVFPPDAIGRLAGLDLMTGKVIVACMGTAAQLYGFDTEKDDRIHILDPGVRMRPTSGLDCDTRIAVRDCRPLRTDVARRLRLARRNGRRRVREHSGMACQPRGAEA